LNPSNKFTVYNASAGSGKTFTLVKEYILLLLQNQRADSYKNILAITFTNKAVAEMKSRVLLNLNGLAAAECPEDCKGLLKELIKESGLTGDQIQKKSREVLKSILHNYASFDISTIDRFTHKIIRTFARDLGLPTHFEVELNNLQILQEAIDKLINRAGEDKELTKVLINFTLSKTDEDKSWDIARDIFTFSKILLFENHQQYVAALKGKSLKDFHQFSIRIKNEIKKTEALLEEIAENFFTIVNREGLEKMDFSGGYCFSYFQKLQQKDFNLTYNTAWQNSISEKKLYAGKCLPHKKTILDNHHNSIADLFNSSKKAFFQREYFKQLLGMITPLSLLSEVAIEIDKIKKDRALVLISDFNPTIAAQVQDQPAPFIYERLGERYRNYFIDEFQDTSEMQWTNMIPLIDHALSEEAQLNETAALTLVGDAKQSIYRFRGGKAEQFIGLYDTVNPFTIEKQVANLPYNYRSATNIVNFNNGFFKFLASGFSNSIYGELFNSSSQTAQKEEEGYVNINFIEAKNAEAENILHPEKIFSIIEDLRAKNTLLNDICILTRTRKQSSTVAHYLNERGISIVSSESLLVANSPEVIFVNTVLQYTVNTEDDNLKWSILNFLADHLKIEDRHNIIAQNLEKDSDNFLNWLEKFHIDFNITAVTMLPLYEAAEYIIKSFALVERSNAYLQFYLDFIYEKSVKKPLTIPFFLELWDLQKEKLSIIAPKSDNAVQIMTIHKSKGLEFPVVIYPFANTKIRDVSKEHIWLPLPPEFNDIPFGYFKASSKMLNWGGVEATAYSTLLDQSEFDAINILYVAFTRASKQLYILSCPEFSKGEPNPDKVSGLLINYLKSINKWDGGFEYEFGNNEMEDAKKVEKLNSVSPGEYYSTPILNERVKLVTRSGELWGTSQEEALNKGTLVHNILSETDSFEDLPEALEKYRIKENLDNTEIDELTELISGVINHPELKEYFYKGVNVLREKDIVNPQGEILRPDRLNFKGNKVAIIDYKTGKLRPGHRDQMGGYESILNQMGYEVEKKIIIYINNDVNITFV
jgi:ATP-dependent exoDNAse (exonuclease V) beta subunit